MEKHSYFFLVILYHYFMKKQLDYIGTSREFLKKYTYEIEIVYIVIFLLSCLELQKDEYLAYLTVEFFIWQEANQRTLHWRLNCWVGPIKSVSKKKEREIQNPNNLYKTKQTLLRDHFFREINFTKISWNSSAVFFSYRIPSILYQHEPPGFYAYQCALQCAPTTLTPLSFLTGPLQS